MPFEYTLNPYRGCEFGCGYCYARYTHEYLERDGRSAWDREILVKTRLVEALRAELRPGRFGGGEIAIGTATDPYQPAERRYGITRAALEELARHQGLSVSITTKSPLVVRDLDLLRALGERGELTVNLSLISLDRRLLRRLEPRAPTPESRLRAMERLAANGVRVGLFLMPILPDLVDDGEALEALVARAAEAGAAFVVPDTLFLRSSARRTFLPIVEREFPGVRGATERGTAVRRTRRASTVTAYAGECVRPRAAMAWAVVGAGGRPAQGPRAHAPLLTAATTRLPDSGPSVARWFSAGARQVIFTVHTIFDNHVRESAGSRLVRGESGPDGVRKDDRVTNDSSPDAGSTGPRAEPGAGGARPDLVRSAELSRLLIESVQDYAIYALDTEGRVVHWPESARRIKGYVADEVLGRNFRSSTRSGRSRTVSPRRGCAWPNATGAGRARGGGCARAARPSGRTSSSRRCATSMGASSGSARSRVT